MPCHCAITNKNITISPDYSVEKALKTIKKEKVRALAIIDDDNKFQGFFSLKTLLKNLIPVSVVMSDGLQIDIKVEAAPGIAKRMASAMPLSVFEFMDRKPASVLPDEPIWEGVAKLTKYGEPLCVVDDKGRYLGMITYESLVNDLQNTEITDG